MGFSFIDLVYAKVSRLKNRREVSSAYYTSSQKKLKYQKNVAMEFSGASAGSSSMQVRTGPFCLYATWNL